MNWVYCFPEENINKNPNNSITCKFIFLPQRKIQDLFSKSIMPVESQPPNSVNEKETAVVMMKVDSKQHISSSSSNFKNFI